MDKIRQRHHHDDEYYDEIRIRTVPRFKTSELSGDEWRTSGVIEILRKGHMIATASFRNVETAAKALSWLLCTYNEDPEFKRLTDAEERLHCQQPGCKEPPAKVFRLKLFQISQQHGLMVEFDKHEPRDIWFCAKHVNRGDCGLEDRDDNYELVVNFDDAVS